MDPQHHNLHQAQQQPIGWNCELPNQQQQHPCTRSGLERVNSHGMVLLRAITLVAGDESYRHSTPKPPKTWLLWQRAGSKDAVVNGRTLQISFAYGTTVWLKINMQNTLHHKKMGFIA